MKETRSLETRRIMYSDRRRPHDKPQELKVHVRRGDVIDDDYAAVMVAARLTMPLADDELGNDVVAAGRNTFSRC